MVIRAWLLLPLLWSLTFADTVLPPLKGKVESVEGTTVRIRLDTDGTPQKGDKVEIADEVPEVGLVPLDGMWQVASVEGRVVTAEAVGNPAAKPRVGYSATIHISDTTPPVLPDPPPGSDLGKADPLALVRPGQLDGAGPSFKGLEVGRSSARDAVATLGQPLRTDARPNKGTVLSYDGGKLGTGPLRVFARQDGVITALALELPRPIPLAAAEQRLGLPPLSAAAREGEMVRHRYSRERVDLWERDGQLVALHLGESPPLSGSGVDDRPKPQSVAWLGLRMGHLTRDAARDLGVPDGQGALVVGTSAKSPAHKAGLAPEDVVRAVNGNAVADRGALAKVIEPMRPGDRVVLDFVRRGSRRRAQLQLAQKPELAAGATPRLIEYGLAWAGLLAGAGPGGQGIVVKSVSSRGAAERAGLRVGDALLAWNGHPIADLADVYVLLDQCQPRERVGLTISRGGRQGRITLVAEPAPLANQGRVTAPIPAQQWGLVVRELNPATARVLGVEQTAGLYIQQISPRAGVSEKDAQGLAGAVILRVDGIPASRVTSLRPTMATKPFMRLLWAKGKLGGAFLLRRP